MDVMDGMNIWEMLIEWWWGMNNMRMSYMEYDAYMKMIIKITQKSNIFFNKRPDT